MSDLFVIQALINKKNNIWINTNYGIWITENEAQIFANGLSKNYPKDKFRVTSVKAQGELADVLSHSCEAAIKQGRTGYLDVDEFYQE